MNKGQERFFVEEAARLLGVEWELAEDRESPDFLIDDGSCRFGLEVSELFAGPVGVKGAERKNAESINQKKIDRCRRTYEKERDVPLDVAILGQVTRETMEELLTEILGRDLAAMGPGERFEVVMNERFKARVMRAFHNRWFRVNDGVGWVNSNPAPVIARAVAKKTGLLPKYREAVGGDVRLLLVANRLFARETPGGRRGDRGHGGIPGRVFPFISRERHRVSRAGGIGRPAFDVRRSTFDVRKHFTESGYRQHSCRNAL